LKLKTSKTSCYRRCCFKTNHQFKSCLFCKTEKFSHQITFWFVLCNQSKRKQQKPVKGVFAYVAYAGYLENGTLFDTSDPELAKSLGQLNQQKAAQNGYKKLPFDIGAKGGMIKGFEEGLSKLNYGDKAVLFIPSNLAFGENGAGDLIPPNANLIFEVQLLENN